MAEIDRIIHAPARLRIMSALMALQPGTQLDFRTLGRTLDVAITSRGRTRFEEHVEALREICRVPNSPNL